MLVDIINIEMTTWKITMLFAWIFEVQTWYKQNYHELSVWLNTDYIYHLQSIISDIYYVSNGFKPINTYFFSSFETNFISHLQPTRLTFSLKIIIELNNH